MPRGAVAYRLNHIFRSSFLTERSPKLFSRGLTQNARNKPTISRTPFRQLSRHMSSMDGIGRGTDLLAESLAFGDRPKILLDGYGPRGFDVMGIEGTPLGKPTHMNGSCLVFPHACYLWRPNMVNEVNIESLAAVTLHSPRIEMLLIGSKTNFPPRVLNSIKKELRKSGVIVEQTDLGNAMATFNILNGEDRRIAVALLLEEEPE